MSYEQSLNQFINSLEERINGLQSEIEQLKNDNKKELQRIKSNLLKVKNGDSLSSDQIINSFKYTDLSAAQALEIYNRINENFILLDVSAYDFEAPINLPEAIRISYEDLITKTHEFKNKAIRFLVVSEDGTKSILACELLFEAGFYNVNNISGGYKFLQKIYKENKVLDFKVA